MANANREFWDRAITNEHGPGWYHFYLDFHLRMERRFRKLFLQLRSDQDPVGVCTIRCSYLLVFQRESMPLALFCKAIFFLQFSFSLTGVGSQWLVPPWPFEVVEPVVAVPCGLQCHFCLESTKPWTPAHKESQITFQLNKNVPPSTFSIEILRRSAKACSSHRQNWVAVTVSLLSLLL